MTLEQMGEKDLYVGQESACSIVKAVNNSRLKIHKAGYCNIKIAVTSFCVISCHVEIVLARSSIGWPMVIEPIGEMCNLIIKIYNMSQRILDYTSYQAIK